MTMSLDDRRETDAALDERVRAGRERLIAGITPSGLCAGVERASAPSAERSRSAPS